MDLTFTQALETKDKQALDRMLHKQVQLRRANGCIVEGIQGVLDELIDTFYPDIEDIEDYENITMIHFVGTLGLKLKYRNNLISRLYFEDLDANYRRIRMDIAYDGTLYNGFQRQPAKETVQGMIENVLNHLTGERLTITPSGRTDKGVHALKQVVHFDTASPLKATKLKTLMNRMLPTDILIDNATEVPRLFHARFDVQRKVYHYTITHERNPFKGHYALYHEPMDLIEFNALLKLFEGVHDFSGFTRKNDHAMTWRSVHTCKAIRKNSETVVIVESEGFLRHMVRYMVGTALRDLDKGSKNIEKALKDPMNSHVYLAPAEGLTLKDVVYNLK